MSQKKILGKNPVTRWPIVERKSMAAATKIRLRNGAHGRSEIAVASRLPWETTPWCPKKFLIIETNKQTNKKLKNQPVTSSANRPRRTRQRCYRLVDFHEKSITNDEVKRKEQTDWNFLQLKRRKISINRWRHHPIVLDELGNVVVFFFWFPRKINNERSNQNQPIVVWERLQTGIIHLFSRCNCDPVLIYLRLPLFFFSSIAGRVKRIEKKKQEKMMMMMVMMMMMMMKERMKKGRKERKITHSFASFFGFFLWPASAQWRRTGFFLPSFFPYGDPFFFSNFLFGFYFVLPRCRRHCLPRAAMCRVREKKAGLDQSEARIGVLRVGPNPRSTNQRRGSASYALDATRRTSSVQFESK